MTRRASGQALNQPLDLDELLAEVNEKANPDSRDYPIITPPKWSKTKWHGGDVIGIVLVAVGAFNRNRRAPGRPLGCTGGPVAEGRRCGGQSARRVVMHPFDSTIWGRRWRRSA